MCFQVQKDHIIGGITWLYEGAPITVWIIAILAVEAFRWFSMASPDNCEVKAFVIDHERCFPVQEQAELAHKQRCAKALS